MEPLTQEEYVMLSQIACQKIKSYIAEHRLKPGDQLPTERKLAEILEVSRPVIREALVTLEAIGLIHKRQGKGIFVQDQDFSALFHEMLSVRSDDDNNLKQLLEFRIILEQAAMGHIIQHALDADYEQLFEIIAQSEQASLTLTEFIKWDHLFHDKLLSLTCNPYFTQLAKVVNSYFHRLEHVNSIKGMRPERMETVREHRSIVDLLKTRNKEEAEKMIKQHLLSTRSE